MPRSIQGVIRRRILVNFRVDPDVVRPWVPSPFRISEVDGHAMAGICLIRLERMRPGWLATGPGLGSDNVAYRIAVHWDEGGQRRDGVFVPRRDTSSSLQHRIGGRFFPGMYHRSWIDTRDDRGVVEISCRSDDGAGDVRFVARETDQLPSTSVFGSLEEAAAFFQRGAVGYSASRHAARLDGLLLQTNGWSVAPLDVEVLESSYFANSIRFPPGSATLDDALIMRNVAHTWRALPSIEAPASSGDAAESYHPPAQDW
jgi:hypothetical protein